MEDTSEESTGSLEDGEQYQVTISRVTNSRNRIAVIDGTELNLGPLTCPPGTEVEIMILDEEFAVCLNREVWPGNYRITFRRFLGESLPENLPTPETRSRIPSDNTEVNHSSKSSSGRSETQDRENARPKLEDLRRKADQEARTNPTASTRSVRSVQEYTRSTAIKRYVKARADGVCEGCGTPAPFKDSEGEPYLHTHHVHELSKGGSDTPETVIALCPNCHYRVHHGEDGDKYNDYLIEQLAEIEEKSIDEIQF